MLTTAAASAPQMGKAIPKSLMSTSCCATKYAITATAPTATIACQLRSARLAGSCASFVA